MNIRIFWVCAMDLMRAQRRRGIMLSSERVGSGVKSYLDSQRKVPLTGRLRGGSNRRCRVTLDSEPDALPAELLLPPTPTPPSSTSLPSSPFFWGGGGSFVSVSAFCLVCFALVLEGLLFLFFLFFFLVATYAPGVHCVSVVYTRASLLPESYGVHRQTGNLSQHFISLTAGQGRDLIGWRNLLSNSRLSHH